MIEKPRPAIEDIELHRMPLIEHLKELRGRVVRMAIAMFVGMSAGLYFATDIYDFLRAPIQAVFETEPKNQMDVLYLWLTAGIRAALPAPHVPGSLNIGGSPLEGMYSYFQIGIIGGAVLASPVIAFQIWQFIAPGLYQSERRLVLPLTLSSTFLFLLGAAFCYAVIFPVSFPFFLTALDASAIISVQGYLESVVWMLMGFGLCFQLPVVIWFFGKIGLIDARDLISGFRYAIVGIFLVAAIVTPTADVLTQTLLAVPLMGLYGIGIVVAYFTSTKVRPPAELTAAT